MNRRDRGSAPVEFVLISVLLVVVTVTVLQISFVSHIRSIAIDSAIAGATHAALADTTDTDGVARTEDLIGRGIARGLVQDVSVGSARVGDREVVVVSVNVAIPAVGPWLPLATLEVRGRAFREGLSNE
jgi:Flp pilus assembly protein TadG